MDKEREREKENRETEKREKQTEKLRREGAKENDVSHFTTFKTWSTSLDDLEKGFFFSLSFFLFLLNFLSERKQIEFNPNREKEKKERKRKRRERGGRERGGRIHSNQFHHPPLHHHFASLSGC